MFEVTNSSLSLNIHRTCDVVYIVGKCNELLSAMSVVAVVVQLKIVWKLNLHARTSIFEEYIVALKLTGGSRTLGVNHRVEHDYYFCVIATKGQDWNSLLVNVRD